jgi:hypothetical protein
MTEGEVCLDRAKMIETQRQTQLNRDSAVKIRFLNGNTIYGSKMNAVCLSSEPCLGDIWGMSVKMFGNTRLDKIAPRIIKPMHHPELSFGLPPFFG